METEPDNLHHLHQKLNVLIRKHSDLQMEILDLKEEIDKIETKKITPAAKAKSQQEEVSLPPQKIPEPVRKPSMTEKKPSKIKQDFEKFIGENLINKIGIGITIIGVGIGAKYAIDNQLLSPLMRIIGGYLVGIILLVFALRLKQNYEKFSAVLLSGAMAILYFITFAAYSFYDLIPLPLTFTLMVLFTVFTVFASIKYDQEVISIIGLVGAYAVPFLLSNDSGRVEILFSYIAIINTGILAISIKRYWKKLYFSAFFLTWIIYSGWFLFEYNEQEHFNIAILFGTIYFAIFYASFLTNKLLQKEAFNKSDIVLLLLNSFLFYGFGYAVFDSYGSTEDYLGLFTLGNAIIHFIVSLVIFKNRFPGKNLFYFTGALVLVFVTITFPVQFDGNWVTLFWVGEAALLFWIGRTKGLTTYEKLSYPLMILAFFSQLQDFSEYYFYYESFTPVFNIDFISALIFSGLFVLINYFNYKNPLDREKYNRKWMLNVMQVIMPGILFIILFLTGYLETGRYWELKFNETKLPGFEDGYHTFNYSLLSYKSVWQVNYTLIFACLVTLLNFTKIKHSRLRGFSVLFALLAIIVFLTSGLYNISELRDHYQSQELNKYFDLGMMPLITRYISLTFFIACLVITHVVTRRFYDNKSYQSGFDLFMHLAILWVASSELIHWMDLAGNPNYKLGLSILWGMYALLMIVLGIKNRKKPLRIGAIVLFSVTLIKLFFYDIAELNTISKTIVFISLGVLLLIISFLYNKYKTLIFDNENE